MTGRDAPPPRRLLLATDLDGRGDRALDRALACAHEWQAVLVALTVLEPGSADRPDWRDALGGSPGPGPSLREIAEQRLRADLATAQLPLTVRAVAGPVAETILAVAAAEDSELIVTGVARNPPLSRVILGSTVDALAARSTRPLLLVRNRVHGPYRHVLVGTDFEPASRHALEQAATLFPQAAFTLFHVYDSALPALAAVVDPMPGLEAGRAAAEREAQAFLETSRLPPALRGRVHVQLAHGHPGLRLRQRGALHPDELVVLGTRQRRGLLGLLLGSQAQRMVEMAPNDVLLVPPEG